MNLLARHAEALFWMGRYVERTTSLARILMVQTAFDRGRAEGASWAWLLALYDEAEDYFSRYDTAEGRDVIRYFMNDPEHSGSVLRSIEAARSNARTLRAMISTDYWIQINRAHRRLTSLSEAELHENRLAHTCEDIQVDCYALFGISSATLYRDAGWRYFMLGIQIEKADQMSRILDVRFAQKKTGSAEGSQPLGDFTHWTMLLRSCGGHHAYRKLVSGPLQPENVARFLIFERSFAPSIAHCIGKLEEAMSELQTACDIPPTSNLSKTLTGLRQMVETAQDDPDLIPNLHAFNDAMQQQLIGFSNELHTAYFDIDADPHLVSKAQTTETPEPEWIKPDDGKEEGGTSASTKTAKSASQSQSQSSQPAQS